MLLSRHVLVINKSPAHQTILKEWLESLGWDMEWYKSIRTADSHSLLVRSAGIGIVVVKELLEYSLKEIETFICNKKTIWLGVVSNEQLGCSRTKHIVRLLNGIFSLSSDINKIKYLLDSAYHQASIRESANRIDTIEFSGITLKSHIPELQRAYRLIYRIAASNAPVLILGESGTGKDLIARAIHDLSVRASGPFVAVNCGAFPSELIQSELFGHEKGAFTGATRQQVGHIEAASGGTLFLDEIGDLDHPLQVNLLRFIESHSIQRLSSNQEIAVDVRIVSATHIDLNQAVEYGRFRLDLLHRLNTIVISLPPLRERKADIELLANQIFTDLSQRYPCRSRGFHPDTIALMKHYHWPGNVREMLNRIKSAIVLCDSELIMPDNLNIRHHAQSKNTRSLNSIRNEAERGLIKNILIKNENNIARSAKEMGVSRVTFYRLIKKHKIATTGEHKNQ